MQVNASSLSSLESKADFVEIKGVKVPLIFEHSKVMPAGEIELIFIGGGNIYNNFVFKDRFKPVVKMASLVLNYGTKKLGNLGFADLLESRAVNLYSGVGNLTLQINLSFLKEEEAFAKDKLKDLLSDYNLTDKSLKDLKTTLYASILSKKSDFDFIASNDLRHTLFTHSPFSYPSIGDKQSLDSITLQDMQDYFNKTLSLENLIIVAGGDIDLKALKKDLSNILSSLNKGSKAKEVSLTIKPLATSKNKDSKNFRAKITKINKDTQQAYIYFGAPFKINNLLEDKIKARVASFILGSSGFGSRLLEEIRVKRGLAYSVYANINVQKSMPYFFGYLQTSLEAQEDAIKITQDIIKDFIKKGVTQKELDDAKSFLLGNEPLVKERLDQRLSLRAVNLINDLPLNYEDIALKAMQELSLKELNEFIKLHTEIGELSFVVVTKKQESK